MTALAYCPVSGKQTYETRNAAQKVLALVQHRPGHKRVGAGVYRCNFEGCTGWHLSQSQNLVQHMRKAEARRKA